MTIPNDLDWSLVAQPLSQDNPYGVDMQYHPDYDAIRRARQTGPDVLPAGLWEREVKKTDWEGIARKCFDFLAYRSKDLQVAAWLTEALAHSDRLAGYTHGLTLLTDLTCNLWDGVFPLIEESDAELRVRPVNWLVQTSLTWIDTNLLTPEGEAGKGAEKADQNAHWQKIESQLLRLEAQFEEKIPGQVTSFQALRASVRARRLASAPVHEQSVSAPAQESNNVGGGGSVNSRDMAYDKLREIAAFLARIEPHSPVPTVLSALVAWRHVGFEDLLERLPKDSGTSVYELLKLFKSSTGNSSN